MRLLDNYDARTLGLHSSSHMLTIVHAPPHCRMQGPAYVIVCIPVLKVPFAFSPQVEDLSIKQGLYIIPVLHTV